MESGDLPSLLRRLKRLNSFQALRAIARHRNPDGTPFTDRLKNMLEAGPAFVPFPTAPVERMAAELAGSQGEEYMLSRNFTKETLSHFGIGYSSKRDMVVVPMHDPNGMLVGFVGRRASHEDKAFKNSDGLPKSQVPWNFHRAKKAGDTVIICEASFDAMRIHQAGHPCVVAVLGGSLSPFHVELLGRTFSTVINMTDFDTKKIHYPNCRRCKGKYEWCNGHRPGRDLGNSIVEKLPSKRHLWATYSEDLVYPINPQAGYRNGPAKDASDMTDDEIRHCVRAARSNLVYQQLGYEKKFENLVAQSSDLCYNG
jgi:hypothetical protein